MSKIKKFEYIKWFWKYIDDETPVLLFYEVDLKNERYATRMAEVFCDKTVKPVIEEGFDFVTEAPIPMVDEIVFKEKFPDEVDTSDACEFRMWWDEVNAKLNQLGYWLFDEG